MSPPEEGGNYEQRASDLPAFFDVAVRQIQTNRDKE
jgi:hypothetical protein